MQKKTIMRTSSRVGTLKTNSGLIVYFKFLPTAFPYQVKGLGFSAMDNY